MTDGQVTAPLFLTINTNSLYEFGKLRGTQTKDQINKFLEMEDTQEFISYCRGSGSNHYNTLRKANESFFPELAEEMKGLADGSQISEDIIWFLNLYELLLLQNYEAKLKRVDNDKDNQNMAFQYPGELVKGCSDILIKQVNSDSSLKRLTIGHNEDMPLDDANSFCCICEAQIGDLKFTSFHYPGMLGGNAFSFNIHGGATVPFICRRLLTAKNIQEVISLIPSIRAGGVSLNVGSLKEERLVIIEIFNDVFSVKEVSGICSHLNHYCFLDSCLAGITNSDTGRRDRLVEMNLEQIENVLGDNENKEFPLWRRFCPTENIFTAATAIFDFLKQNVCIYFDNPKRSEPNVIYSLTTLDKIPKF